MSFGISISNSDDLVVIDTEHLNYSVVATGVVTPIQAGYDGKGTTITFTEQLIPPIVLIRPPIGYYISSPTVVTKSSFSLCHEVGGNSQQCDYLVISKDIGALSTESFGMQVFNSEGGVCFDSRIKYATFQGFGEILTDNVGNFTQTTFSVSSPKRSRFISINGCCLTKAEQYGDPVVGTLVSPFITRDADNNVIVKGGLVYDGGGVQGITRSTNDSRFFLFADM